jgi:hypothetical protein
MSIPFAVKSYFGTTENGRRVVMAMSLSTLAPNFFYLPTFDLKSSITSRTSQNNSDILVVAIGASG